MPRGRPRKNQDILLKSAEMIGWAIGGIEREILATRERLAALTAQANALRAKLPARGRDAAGVASDASEPVAAAGAEGNGRRRRRRAMSPEARKRISDMMKKRWAERRKSAK